MIYLEKGQIVKDREDLVVCEQTGERNDSDMVICAKKESPEEPFCWLEAQYIMYGGLVYTINDEKELEKEILKFDPDTTINDTATTPIESVIIDESVVTQQVEAPQVATPEPTVTTPSQASPTVPEPSAPATTTPEQVPSAGEPISGSNSTSTPPTTEPVVEPEPEPVIPPAEPVVPVESENNTENLIVPVDPLPPTDVVQPDSPTSRISPAKKIAKAAIKLAKKKVRDSMV